MQPWQPDNERGQPIASSSLNWYERNPHPELQGASHIQNPTQDRQPTPVSYSETYQASHVSSDVPSHHSTYSPPRHASQLVSYEPTRRTAHPPNYQSHPSAHQIVHPTSSSPPYPQLYPSPYPAVYTSSSETIRPQSSEESCPPLNQAWHPPTLPAANRSSNASTNITYLTPRLRENLTLYTAAEPESDLNLASNRATSQTEGHEYGMVSRSYTNGPGPVRHSWRSAHSSQYVNNYGRPARNTAMRVPTSYGCQYRGADFTIVCPMLSQERHTVYCLYVNNIRGEPLHVTYNCLVSIFQRYPGFRDLHIIPGHTGAVVSFDTDYQTTIAKRALDGFRIFSKYKLSVKFVDSRIFKYMHLPGFNPEHFFQY